MALCAQVGEGPLIPEMTKTIPQGARARSVPFPKNQGLLTREVQREMGIPSGIPGWSGGPKLSTTVPLGPSPAGAGDAWGGPRDGWGSPGMDEGAQEVLGDG